VVTFLGDAMGGRAFNQPRGKNLPCPADLGHPTVPDRVIASPQVNYTEDIAFYPAPAALPLSSAFP